MTTDTLSRVQLAPWPSFAEDEIAAVEQVLRSGKVNYWTGSVVKNFETAYADQLGVPHAIALANGTVALELALYALGVGPGDEVIVPCRTFIATASSVVMRGATPVCVDVDAQSQNLTAQTIAPHITSKTKAIIAVHLAGWVCDMPEIMALAERHGLKVIEDCAQAHGAQYQQQFAGTFADVATFSFCQDKIMTTGGEGGLLVTANPDLWQRAWSYKDHGKAPPDLKPADCPPGFRWLHQSFGTNWRMTEMQAAIGLKQLQKLPAWVRRRRAHAQHLTRFLSQYAAVTVPTPPADVYHAYYKYYFFVAADLQQAVIEHLQVQGIPAVSGHCPEIYLEQAFIEAGLQPHQRFTQAQHLGQTSVMLPVHPTLSATCLETLCTCLAQTFKQLGIQ